MLSTIDYKQYMTNKIQLICDIQTFLEFYANKH